jgi:hypothetical protein
MNGDNMKEKEIVICYQCHGHGKLDTGRKEKQK